jgi:peptidoglycan-N-acetylglucosamine deacetylase
MIAVEKAAYGQTFRNGEPKDLKDLKLHTPFFRFPGFADTPDLRGWLAAGNVGTFGVDLWASDWIPMTPEAELKLVMRRLEKNGHKGMLLLHDSHPWTAAMLPMLLARLKADGYRIVQMAPGPGTGATASAAPGWTSETERIIGALKPKLEKHAAATPRRGAETKPDSRH